MAKPPKPSKAAQVEKAFEEIAQETIRRAEQVPCSLDRFVEGLRDIESALRDRRGISKEELER